MAFIPRISKETIATNIIVKRQARAGTTPFGWEVHAFDSAEPLYISTDRYTSMADAYGAGQARLPEFIAMRSIQCETTIAGRIGRI